MIKEHDRVVSKKEVPDHGLRSGDVGTVIHVNKKGVAFGVEFLTLQGETDAIATLEASQVRPVRKSEITHARLLGAYMLYDLATPFFTHVIVYAAPAA
jgi:hypothetical protein